MSALEDVLAKDGSVLFPKNHIFDEKDIEVIENEDIDQISVRSVLNL